MTKLVVDVSNICWRNRFGHLKSKRRVPYAKELIMQETVKTIMFCYKKFSCDGMVMAFDDKKNWRKSIYKEYKETRDLDFDIYYDDIKKAIADLYEVFSNYTNICSVKADDAEADDVIATVCEKLSNKRVIILSSDKDFIQLTKNTNHKLFDPISKSYRETSDPDYDLFEKFIRGDRGDNIPSSFPRVRKTRIKKAYDDEYELHNLLNEKISEDKVVADQFLFNQQLIDFQFIPEYVKDNVLKSIEEQRTENYSYANLLKEFGRIGLKELAKNEIANNIFIFKNSFDI